MKRNENQQGETAFLTIEYSFKNLQFSRKRNTVQIM